MSSHEKKSVVLQAGRLQVGFHWHRDRYAHTVGFVENERFSPLLASREGNGEELWPASPVLQAIQVDTTGGRQVAMLVGMAGRSHWSVAVELDTALSRLRFDVACRVKDEPPAGGSEVVAGLRSSYRAMIPPTLDPETGDLVTVGELAISVAAAGVGPAEFDRIRVAEAGLTLHAAGDSRELPRTVQWTYTLEPNRL